MPPPAAEDHSVKRSSVSLRRRPRMSLVNFGTGSRPSRPCRAGRGPATARRTWRPSAWRGRRPTSSLLARGFPLRNRACPQQPHRRACIGHRPPHQVRQPRSNLVAARLGHRLCAARLDTIGSAAARDRLHGEPNRGGKVIGRLARGVEGKEAIDLARVERPSVRLLAEHRRKRANTCVFAFGRGVTAQERGEVGGCRGGESRRGRFELHEQARTRSARRRCW